MAPGPSTVFSLIMCDILTLVGAEALSGRPGQETGVHPCDGAGTGFRGTVTRQHLFLRINRPSRALLSTPVWLTGFGERIYLDM